MVELEAASSTAPPDVDNQGGLLQDQPPPQELQQSPRPEYYPDSNDKEKFDHLERHLNLLLGLFRKHPDTIKENSAVRALELAARKLIVMGRRQHKQREDKEGKHANHETKVKADNNKQGTGKVGAGTEAASSGAQQHGEGKEEEAGKDDPEVPPELRACRGVDLRQLEEMKYHLDVYMTLAREHPDTADMSGRQKAVDEAGKKIIATGHKNNTRREDRLTKKMEIEGKRKMKAGAKSKGGDEEKEPHKRKLPDQEAKGDEEGKEAMEQQAAQKKTRLEDGIADKVKVEAPQ